jgi:hypothetical protein
MPWFKREKLIHFTAKQCEYFRGDLLIFDIFDILKILSFVRIFISSRMETPCESHGLRPVVCFFRKVMAQYRVISFIDGFNLYHAISGLRRPELKWVDVRMLSKAFLRPLSEQLLKVFYFSAMLTICPNLSKDPKGLILKP